MGKYFVFVDIGDNDYWVIYCFSIVYIGNVVFV